MRNSFKKTYIYFITLPDRLYPFASEIEGKWVRGQASYRKALDEALEIYGVGRLGYKLMLYRQLFHFVGSIIFITGATLLSKALFGSDIALYVLLGAAIIALTLQEFYFHPKSFGQYTQKGVADWVAWVLPMAIYLLLFVV